MPYLDFLEAGGGLVFMRDPILTIGPNIIELAMRPKYRPNEIFSLRPLLKQLSARGLSRYVAMPTPTPEAEGLFLKGGNVLLSGRNVLVGAAGKASDLEGAQGLQRFLGSGYRVHPVHLRSDILHLDFAIALVRPGLAIVDPSALTYGLPPLLRGWDVIDVDSTGAESLDVSVLVVNPQTVVVEKEQSRLMRELTARGIGSLPIPFDVPIPMEGSFRRATHPLLRHA